MRHADGAQGVGVAVSKISHSSRRVPTVTAIRRDEESPTAEVKFRIDAIAGNGRIEVDPRPLRSLAEYPVVANFLISRGAEIREAGDRALNVGREDSTRRQLIHDEITGLFAEIFRGEYRMPIPAITG